MCPFFWEVICSFFFFEKKKNMSKDHPIGLEAWEARRKEWTTPPQDFDFKTIQRYQEAFEELGDSEKKVGIYKQLVQQLQTFTQPVPLKFIVKKILQIEIYSFILGSYTYCWLARRRYLAKRNGGEM